MKVSESYDYGVINPKGIIFNDYIYLYFVGISSENQITEKKSERIFLTKIKLSAIKNLLENKELWYENTNK
ncbi:hypothetical protein J7L48_10445 [bacterium]|nr:hypothetical protein [bacterium]